MPFFDIMNEFMDELCNILLKDWRLVGEMIYKLKDSLVYSTEYIGLLYKFSLNVSLDSLHIDILHEVSHWATQGFSAYILDVIDLL